MGQVIAFKAKYKGTGYMPVIHDETSKYAIGYFRDEKAIVSQEKMRAEVFEWLTELYYWGDVNAAIEQDNHKEYRVYIEDLNNAPR